MKKIMAWLENDFSPVMNKFAQNPWVSAISGAMMKILPVILVGCLIFFYGVFTSWFPNLPDFGNVLTFTFMLTSLVLAFFLGNMLMENLGHQKYSLTGGIVSVIMYLIACKPQFGDVMTVDSGRFGPSGMFVAICISLIVGLVYHLWAKVNFLEDSTVIPDFVADWINQMIPLAIVVFVGTFITYNMDQDIYGFISGLFAPIEKIGLTLPGFTFMVFFQAFMYSLGISSWFVSAFTTPVLMKATEMNMAAHAAGQIATQIACYENVYALSFVTLGGTGCTLMLNVLMLLSKSNKMKTLGRICIAPSIFNINEPVVFGAPCVFNPLLMIPMWICSIVTPIMLWIIQSLRWLAVPYATSALGQMPAPLGYFVVMGDWRCFLWWFLFAGVTLAIWYPFFKVYEKQLLAEEAAEAAE